MADLLSLNIQDNRVRSRSSSETGSTGERIAARYLAENGYRLVMRNFKVPVGRNTLGAQTTGEIDIIALDGDTLCFVEVKTRRSIEFALPTANVDLRKQRQITRTARAYRDVFRVFDMKHRFDVVSIVMEKGTEPVVELHKSFWHEGKFKKRLWSGDIW
jgi:putative endonuclease